MHATSTQTRADTGKALAVVLAALIFAAGIALGTAIGISLMPAAAPAAAEVQALDPDAPWFREHRDGEINAASGPAGDRSYDAVEETRADRGLSLPAGDRSYDAVEETRADRGID